MSYGVFRRYPYERLWRRQVIFSQPRAMPIYYLPSASELCDGGRVHFRFYVHDAVGLRIVATNGNTIRIGANVTEPNGYVKNTTIGETLHLVALNDTEYGAIDEYHEDVWTVSAGHGISLITGELQITASVVGVAAPGNIALVTANLEIETFAPLLAPPVEVTFVQSNLQIETFAPEIILDINLDVLFVKSNLRITSSKPTVVNSSPTPLTAQLQINSYAITVGMSFAAAPQTGQLEIGSFAPTVVNTASPIGITLVTGQLEVDGKRVKIEVTS
jgi:hypothetical protein